MKKVLYIIPYSQLFPPKNGGMLRNYFLCSELSKYYEVTLLTFQPSETFINGTEDYYWNSHIKVITIPVPPEPQSRIRKTVNAVKGRIYQRNLFQSAGAYALYTNPVLKKLLKEQQYSYVLFAHVWSLNLAYLVKRYAAASVSVLDAHNVDHLLFAQEKNMSLSENKKQYRQLKKEEATIYKQADFFLACSEKDQTTLETLNRNQIKGFVIPNGADAYRNQFQTVKDLAVKQVLFCGSLDYEPNRDGLLWFYREIWPLLLKAVPAIRLTVIGRNGNSEHYRELQADVSIDFIGEVVEVKEYYYKTTVSIVPLRMGSGTRLKILEAMSLGNPVVSTGIGAEGINCIPGTEILIANDALSFAGAVTALLQDTEKANQLRINARKLIDEVYSWEMVGRRLADTLNNQLLN